jgi:hypothetical protein
MGVQTFKFFDAVEFACGDIRVAESTVRHMHNPYSTMRQHS